MVLCFSHWEQQRSGMLRFGAPTVDKTQRFHDFDGTAWVWRTFKLILATNWDDQIDILNMERRSEARQQSCIGEQVDNEREVTSQVCVDEYSLEPLEEGKKLISVRESPHDGSDRLI